MEKKNTSVFYNGMVWGLILGFTGIIYNVILYMAGQFANRTLGYVGILITIVILIFGFRSFRDQVRDGVMPFGTAFGFGVVVILVSGLLGSLYNYVMMAVIDPDLLSKILDMQLEKTIEKSSGRATPEQIEEGFELLSWMFKPVMMSVLGFLSSAFFGTIIALIMAAIFKRDEDLSADLLVAEETAATGGTEETS